MDGTTGTTELKKAKGYALRLLKFRPRASDELRRRMLDKGFEPGMVAGIIEDLTGAGFLDDAAFARAWVQYRLNKSMGFRRIAMELAEKGVSQDLVDAAFRQVMGHVDELEVVRRLAEKRAVKYHDIDPLKRRKRLMDYLVRRGFGMDAIMKVIRKI